MTCCADRMPAAHHLARALTVAAALLAAGWLSLGSAHAETTLTEVAEGCEAATNMGPELCACIAAMAMEDLNEQQRAWYVAAMAQNDAATATLRAAMSPGDLMDAASFVTDAPTACAGQ